MPHGECLSEDELRAFHLGELGADNLDAAAAHLEECAACEAAVTRLDGVTDKLLAQLRALRPALEIQVPSNRPSQGREPVTQLLAGSRRVHQPTGSPPGYELLDVLGRGGMGVVYRARQLDLNRVVALKMVLAGSQSTSEERVRFQVEAQLIGQLAHPNIVQIHEAGQHDGLPFFALELVSGGTLAERLRRDGPLRPREAAALAEQLARAMHYAHLQGVIHRDLKPANILLGREGSPKITDFGLGRRSADTSGLTAVGTVIGTPAYMAPEQANGGRISPAADVYALGAILYECLAGHPPFLGETVMEILTKVLAEAVEPLPGGARQVPRDLQTVSLRCLEKEPGRRYVSAEAMADDLARFLAGEPVLARPIGKVERLVKWARRRPAIAVLSAGLALLIGIAFGLLVHQNRQANEHADIQERLSTQAQATSIDLAVALAKNRQGTADLVFDQAMALCQKGEIGRGLTAFARCLSLAVEVGDSELERGARFNLTAWAGVYIRRRATCKTESWCNAAVLSPDDRTLLTAGCDDKAVQLWEIESGKPLGDPMLHSHPVWSVDFGPGQTVLSGSGSLEGTPGEVRVWDLRSRKCLKTLEFPSTVERVAYHPVNAKTFLTVCDRYAQLWATDTYERVGRPMTLSASPAGTDSSDGRVLDACFSPDGSLVLVVGRVIREERHVGEARLYETATGELRTKMVEHDKPIRLAAFSDDGRLVATGGGEEARVWSTAENPRTSVRMPHAGPITALVFSPDSRTLATGNMVLAREPSRLSGVGGKAGQARLWEVSTGEPLTVPLTHDAGAVGALAFSPKGGVLLTGCVDGRTRLFSTMTGKRIGNPMEGAGNVCSIRFSRDGRVVVTANNGNSARIWEVPSLEQSGGYFREAAGHVHAVSYSPDGSSLLTGTEEGIAQLWNLNTREETSRFCHGGPLRHVGFHPDGNVILSGHHSAVQKWDRQTGALRAESPGLGKSGKTAFSPDRRTVAGVSGLGLSLWDSSSGRAMPAPPSVGPLVEIGWDPAGGAVFTAAPGGSLERRELPIWKLTTRYPTEAGSRFFSVSPDRKILLTLGPDRRWLHRWNRQEGTSLGQPLAIDGSLIYAAVFSPDSQRLLTCDENGAAQLWDPTSGKPLGPPAWIRGAAYSAAFRPDGRQLVIGRIKLIQIVDLPEPMKGTPTEIRQRIDELTYFPSTETLP